MRFTSVDRVSKSLYHYASSKLNRRSFARSMNANRTHLVSFFFLSSTLFAFYKLRPRQPTAPTRTFSFKNKTFSEERIQHLYRRSCQVNGLAIRIILKWNGNHRGRYNPNTVERHWYCAAPISVSARFMHRLSLIAAQSQLRVVN